MPTLSYSGRKPVKTNDDGTVTQDGRDELHALLDDAIDAYENDTIIRVRTALVHFERSDNGVAGDMPRMHLDIEADGKMEQLGTVKQNITEAVVQIGMEKDVETASERVTIQ